MVKWVRNFIPLIVFACSVCWSSFLLFCDTFLVVVHVCFCAHVARVVKLLHGAQTQIPILFYPIFGGYIFIFNFGCVGFCVCASFFGFLVAFY